MVFRANGKTLSNSGILGIFVLSVIHCPSLFYRPWLIDLVWVGTYVLWPGQGNTKWLLLPLLQISKVITILFCPLVHIWTSVISRWVRPLVSRLLKPRWLVDLRTTRQFWTGRSLFMAFVVRIETFSLQQVSLNIDDWPICASPTIWDRKKLPPLKIP